MAISQKNHKIQTQPPQKKLIAEKCVTKTPPPPPSTQTLCPWNMDKKVAAGLFIPPPAQFPGPPGTRF